MGNMSYCRFQNTRGDFKECAEIIEEMINQEAHDPLSKDELDAAKRLMKTAADTVMALAESMGLDFGVLDQFNQLVNEKLDNLNSLTEESKRVHEDDEDR